MIKWVEISGKASKLRFDYLSQFLKKIGKENQVDYIECNLESFHEKFKLAINNYEHIRVGTPFGEKAPLEVPHMPVVTLLQKTSDCLVKQGGRWWPRSMLTEGLTREVAVVKKLDISESALIIGAGSSCRAVIAALLKIGFKKFNITEQFEERGSLLVQDLQKTYFGVEFKFVPPSAITLLPGVHTIVVNTTPLTPTNSVLNELYYCNFLKPNGVVVDLTLFPVETPLLKAVKQVDSRVIHGYEVASLVDAYWLQVSMGISIDAEDYAKGLKEICEKEPFDLSPYEIPGI